MYPPFVRAGLPGVVKSQKQSSLTSEKKAKIAIFGQKTKLWRFLAWVVNDSTLPHWKNEFGGVRGVGGLILGPLWWYGYETNFS